MYNNATASRRGLDKWYLVHCVRESSPVAVISSTSCAGNSTLGKGTGICFYSLEHGTGVGCWSPGAPKGPKISNTDMALEYMQKVLSLEHVDESILRWKFVGLSLTLL